MVHLTRPPWRKTFRPPERIREVNSISAEILLTKAIATYDFEVLSDFSHPPVFYVIDTKKQYSADGRRPRRFIIYFCTADNQKWIMHTNDPNVVYQYARVFGIDRDSINLFLESSL